jgi:hypothetical protein
MSKKDKKKKRKKKDKAMKVLRNGAAGIATSDLVVNIVSRVIADLIELYLSDHRNVQKVMKSVRRLTSGSASSGR